MMNKKGFEFTFAWIFAIIVGAVIMFLAVYATYSLISTERSISDTEAAKQFGIILTPVETNLESSKITPIKFNEETRIYNRCRTEGNFGVQEIGVSLKSGFGKTWQEPKILSSFYNKYIFSSETITGKGAFVFAKQFNFPFKIGDLIIILGEDKYCFVNPPNDIEEEIGNFKETGSFNNINITLSINECSKDSKKVCFGSLGCDIDVSLASKSVRKNNQVVFYEDSLIYGAIFSDPQIYECQVKRLMKRTAELSLIYALKSENLAVKGCSSNLKADLIAYTNKTLMLNNSLDLGAINFDAKDLGGKNDLLLCRLF